MSVQTTSTTSPGAAGVPPAAPGRGVRRAIPFLLPALILLGIYIAYPLVFTVVRSLFDRNGEAFVGLGNYIDVFSDNRTLVAIRNNAIWVLVAPTIVTALGLIFAVLTERIKWAAAFRLVLFMPMAISLFASGVIFRLVYDENPDLGFTNAITVSIHDMFSDPSEYPGARPRDTDELAASDAGFTTSTASQPGDTVELPLVGFATKNLPEGTSQAVVPEAPDDGISGVVWLDAGARGESGVLDEREQGMPRVTVEALQNGEVVATATTGDDGTFVFPDLASGSYDLRLPSDNFTEAFRGLSWLGPGLVTPVIISAWVWIMTGFALTFIAAGLSAIPRDALEAARVDGATEWQVFRRVTMPLLSPILLVVFVTLVINVLKIFELVYVIAPGSSQSEANVLALQMWQVSFGAGGNQGQGSAIAVLLFLLVLPAMIFNIRRFRKERKS